MFPFPLDEAIYILSYLRFIYYRIAIAMYGRQFCMEVKHDAWYKARWRFVKDGEIYCESNVWVKCSSRIGKELRT